MNNIKIENEIIALIPSNTIKNAVMELKHKFSEIELVQIITEFAPSWVEMIDLLSDLKKYVEDDKVKTYITKYVNMEKRQYKLLINQEDGYVYDVVMSSNERYLVPDFESAYVTINNFLKCYKKEIGQNEYSNIEIFKRKISKRSSIHEIDCNDEPVSCDLNNKKQIRRIYSHLPDVDTEKIGIELNPIRYPSVFKKGDLIFIDKDTFPYLSPCHYFTNYYNTDDAKIYGINSFDNTQEYEGQVDVCCFLELSCDYVVYRKIDLDENGYCPYLMCHYHVDFGYFEKANLSSVPIKIKEDYEYTLEKLIELKCL